MSASILDNIKKLLSVPEDYTVFDTDITMHINTVFTTLHQLGIGPDNGFFIEDNSITWDEYLGSDTNLNSVKTYIYLRVRLLFDPPATSFAIAAIKEQITELEWRLNTHREMTSVVPAVNVLDGGDAGEE